MVVRGKTLINAVWANLSRWGGGKNVARTHHTGIGMERIANAANEVDCYLLCVGH